MAIPFIPMLISGLLRGVGAGAQAYGATQANKRNAAAAALRRSRFMELINRARNRDLSGLDAQASDVFSRAADQIDATSAQRGMLRAPNAGAGRQRAETFAQVLAQLAEARAADQRAAQDLEARLLSDESFGVLDPSHFDPGASAFIAGLGGLAGGAGETLGNFFGTDAGIEALGLGKPAKPTLRDIFG